ncbi:hypothetical protein [Enterococcus dongliensis]|uniref:hypothetical protein n=1 Tax=Enterococcus dongliensis TaxID=2559925 RepID=UPI00288CD4CA|nr:hypothetical protein [Enterococcus dongliensis]MDT2669687.1 hypothetical protein [Enterococcus dongliensis]MDT2674612.1 hypothetical protein [Enterococcus dongliensis]
MNNVQRKKAHLIIHSASTAAAIVGAGMAQFPVPDATVLLPIQTAMVISLGKIFHMKLEEGVAKSLATQFLAQKAGQMTTRFLIGKLPIAGSVINGSTAAAITESYGWIIAKEFAEDSSKKNKV